MIDDLSHRLAAVTKAVDNVLVASNGPMRDLVAHHITELTVIVPFWTKTGESAQERYQTPMDDALRFYGNTPLFRMWCLLRAVGGLREAWMGQRGTTLAMTPPAPEPAQGPGNAMSGNGPDSEAAG